jgi:hypothetical protein
LPPEAPPLLPPAALPGEPPAAPGAGAVELLLGAVVLPALGAGVRAAELAPLLWLEPLLCLEPEPELSQATSANAAAKAAAIINFFSIDETPSCPGSISIFRVNHAERHEIARKFASNPCRVTLNQITGQAAEKFQTRRSSRGVTISIVN